jgi:hypothetical protein
VQSAYIGLLPPRSKSHLKVKSTLHVPSITLNLWNFYAPAIKWLGHIVLPCSVIPSSSVFVHYLSNGCTHSSQIWHMDISRKNTGQVGIWTSSGLMIFGPWWNFCPLVTFSVSVHYLPNGITHLTQTWDMDASKECAGQVRIWSWFNNFWHSYAPFTLKKRKFSVSVHYLPNSCTYSTQI